VFLTKLHSYDLNRTLVSLFMERERTKHFAVTDIILYIPTDIKTKSSKDAGTFDAMKT
jgi:hypothetical protein